MPTLTFEMSGAVAQRMDQAVRSGGYTDASEYVAYLVKRDAERARAAEALEVAIRKSVASGDPIQITPEEVGERMMRAALEAHEKREEGV